MKTHINIPAQLLPVALAVTYSVSLSQPSLAAKAHPPHRASKHITKHLSAVHPTPIGAGQGAGVPYRTPEEMRDLSDTLNSFDHSFALSKQGDASATQGDWKAAEPYYQQALDVRPDNSEAIYGLGKCADAAGNTEEAISHYRKVVYTTDPHRYGTVPGDGYNTNDVTRLMEFVLLLNKVGQEQEALKVYRRTAHLLNYRDADTNGGKPYLKVLLPEFGSGPGTGKAAYTPQRLEAMARVGIAIESRAFDGKQALPQDREAIALYPDSPVAYYYLGEHLMTTKGAEAKAAYQKAAQLGDEQVGAAAAEAMKVLR